jgi:hypothetical protein
MLKTQVRGYFWVENGSFFSSVVFDKKTLSKSFVLFYYILYFLLAQLGKIGYILQNMKTFGYLSNMTDWPFLGVKTYSDQGL